MPPLLTLLTLLMCSKVGHQGDFAIGNQCYFLVIKVCRHSVQPFHTLFRANNEKFTHCKESTCHVTSFNRMKRRRASVCITLNIMWRQPEKLEFMWQTFFHLSISYTEFLSLPIRWMRHGERFMNVYVGRVLHIYFQLRSCVNLLIPNSGYLV